MSICAVKKHTESEQEAMSAEEKSHNLNPAPLSVIHVNKYVG